MKQIKMINKTAWIIYLILFSTIQIQAQKGLFVKASMGPGYITEYSKEKISGLTIISKAHAIGWGFTDRFAIKVGEFGGLNKVKVGDYKYINIDAYGLGVSYRLPKNIHISMLTSIYGKLSYAKKWTEPSGKFIDNGFGVNLNLEKEWLIARRWGLRLGPQMYWFKTKKTNHKFFNASLNGSVVFYLTPVL